jgi:Peptidase_C39 like family/Bacterial SH3 domain
MPFRLVYYSQQDPRWKNDRLGFGQSEKETIGFIGCALTSVSMMLSGHGYTETPQTLNKKLQSAKGFVGSGIAWYAVSQIYPQVRINSIIKCYDTPAPLAQIDGALAKGQPAIVCVDSQPSPEFRSHYIVLIGRKGNDYLMLDPWPYQTDVNKETYLMPRYSQGNPLQRSIMQIVLYENIAADGAIQLPGVATPMPAPSGQPQPSNQPTPAPVATGPHARVRDDVTFGLNIRSSEDTSSKANVVDTVPAGTLLTIAEPNGWTQIGAINQWIRVRTPKGKEGLAAAWYLEKAPGETYPTVPDVPDSTTEPASEPTAGKAPATQTSKLVVKVQKNGLPVYESNYGKGKVLFNEKNGARLVVVEDPSKAASKIGSAGSWLNVKASSGKRGFVDAGSVKLV